MVEIFSDRLEIANPGEPLIPTLRFIDEPPQSRNESLAGLMRRLNICEESPRISPMALPERLKPMRPATTPSAVWIRESTESAIERAGFKTFIEDQVAVGINSTVRADATLQLGPVNETVQVMANPLEIKTDRGDLSQQVDRTQVENLPLSPDATTRA